MSSSSLKRDPEESLADRRKRLKAHAEAHFKSTRAAWADLPPDALRLVVKRAADVAGSSVPVVPAVASACRAWREAAHAHPSELWRRADFSGDFDPSDAVIARYCRDGHWRALEHLDLRDCPRVSDKALDALFVDDARRGAPALSSLFVSDVDDDRKRTDGVGKTGKNGKRGISVDGLVRVLERAPITFGTVEIDRCHVRSGVERERLSRALFANGASRVALALRDAPRMFANVAPFVAPAGMPLLTKLDLTDSGGGAGGAVLPWIDLMAKCPAMRELRLNGLGGAQGWEPKPRLGSSNDPFGNPSATRARREIRRRASFEAARERRTRREGERREREEERGDRESGQGEGAEGTKSERRREAGEAGEEGRVEEEDGAQTGFEGEKSQGRRVEADQPSAPPT